MSLGGVGEWPALESNPTAMTNYVRSVGVPAPVQVVEVVSFDADTRAAVAMPVPQPTHAVIVLFPEGKQIRDARAAEYAAGGGKKADDVFFMRQKIRNACGTFALLHALANSDIDLGSGAFADFLRKAKTEAPEDRSKCLFDHKDMSDLHHKTADAGDTAQPEEVTLHFIAYVNRNGRLIEIDSAMEHAYDRGATSGDSLLDDVGKQFNQLIQLAGDSDKHSFSAMALVGADA